MNFFVINILTDKCIHADYRPTIHVDIIKRRRWAVEYVDNERAKIVREMLQKLARWWYAVFFIAMTMHD